MAKYFIDFKYTNLENFSYLFDAYADDKPYAIIKLDLDNFEKSPNDSGYILLDATIKFKNMNSPKIDMFIEHLSKEFNSNFTYPPSITRSMNTLHIQYRAFNKEKEIFSCSNKNQLLEFFIIELKKTNIDTMDYNLPICYSNYLNKTNLLYKDIKIYNLSDSIDEEGAYKTKDTTKLSLEFDSIKGIRFIGDISEHKFADEDEDLVYIDFKVDIDEGISISSYKKALVLLAEKIDRFSNDLGIDASEKEDSIVIYDKGCFLYSKKEKRFVLSLDKLKEDFTSLFNYLNYKE